MAGLSTGSVPSLYRDVYESLITSSTNKIPKQLWLKAIATSRIADTTAQEIWKVCDPNYTNSFGRDQLYKSLALVALAQQGKPLDEKVLLNYADKELPTPTIAPLSELKTISAHYVRATNPTELGYTYEELKGLDEIKVTLLPEKKGTLIKHNEYTIESKSFASSVCRRYKDFEGFHQILSFRFPFRLVPNLPPKGINPSELFIEQRRRALKRYLTLICRHPVLSRDDVVRYFFTASGQDVGARIKEKYKNTSDELSFNPLAEKAKELVTEHTRMKYERVREQLTLMLKIMTAIVTAGETFEVRSRGIHENMKVLYRELISLSSESALSTPWTSGSDDSWSKIQSDCRHLADQFNVLGDRSLLHAENEAKGFAELAHLFLDLLMAYQELCIRREKLVHRKHQKALAKVQTMEKFKGHLEAQGKAMSEKEQSKLQKNDDELMLMERRNFFSLFCLDLEAQLIHANLSQLPDMFKSLVHTQVGNHQVYLKLWEDMKPLVDGMGSAQSSNHSSLNFSDSHKATSRDTSPQPIPDTTSPFH